MVLGGAVGGLTIYRAPPGKPVHGKGVTRFGGAGGADDVQTYSSLHCTRLRGYSGILASI